MTIEEAIRILDPETTGEALAEYDYYGGFCGWKAMELAFEEACRMGVQALREKQDGGWTSVPNGFPEIDKEVLVVAESKNGTQNIGKGYWTGNRFVHRGLAQITHWQPLPELPKKEEEA